MKLGVLFVLVVAACGNKADDYPIGPGGPPGGTNGGDDDGSSGTDSGTTPTDVRVCLNKTGDLADPSKTDNCATMGVTGFKVQFGDDTPVVTGADGTFTLPIDLGNPNQVWRVTGPGGAVQSVPSIIPFVSGHYVLPSIAQGDFTNILAGNPSAVATGGQVFIHVTSSSGQAQSGVAVTSVPNPVAEFYDSSGVSWDQAAVKTSTRGGVWLSGLTPGSATITLTLDVTHHAILNNVTVEDGSNTYLFVEL